MHVLWMIMIWMFVHSVCSRCVPGPQPTDAAPATAPVTCNTQPAARIITTTPRPEPTTTTTPRPEPTTTTTTTTTTRAPTRPQPILTQYNPCGPNMHLSVYAHRCLSSLLIDLTNGAHRQLTDVINPCREMGPNAIAQFYEFPGNARMYIQCDQYGGGYVKQCPAFQVWYQRDLTCI